MKKSLLFICLAFFTLSIYCQNPKANKTSYVVWMSEFEKGWIDSEDEYYLLESESNADFTSPEKSFNPSFLLIGDEYDFQLCCGSIDQKKTDLTERYFFSQKETLTLKYKSVTIRITPLNQTNCKCSAQTVNKNSESQTKFSMIKESDFVKIEKQQRKNIIKNKIQLIEYLKKI